MEACGGRVCGSREGVGARGGRRVCDSRGSVGGGESVVAEQACEHVERGSRRSLIARGQSKKLRDHTSNHEHEAESELELGQGYQLSNPAPSGILRATPPHSLPKQLQEPENRCSNV